MGYYTSIYTAGLPHRAVAVYMYLRDRADKDNRCWPAIRTIGRELRLSRSTVKRALRDLEDAGFLTRAARYRENGSNTSNMFFLR